MLFGDWLLFILVQGFAWLVDYCSVAAVKGVLHIDASETSEDAELVGCVMSGSAIVDGVLKVYGLSVPVVVPQLVKEAAAFFAGWRYRQVRDSRAAEELWVSGQRTLQTYIDGVSEPYVGMV